MSAQQTPLTYEGILEMFRETGERMKETERIIQGVARRQEEVAVQMKDSDQKLERLFQETDRKFQESAEQIRKTDEQIRKTSQEIGQLGSRVGNMVEDMVAGGNIINQFRALGHHVITYSRRKIFGERGSDASGEIDLFLEDGDVAILVEVKTRLKTDGVLDHIERMEKYRKCMDISGSGSQKRYIGAVASPSVEENVVKFAHKKGFYVIVQTGDLFEIVKPPEGFSPKTW
jgi:hypothetical protein